MKTFYKIYPLLAVIAIVIVSFLNIAVGIIILIVLAITFALFKPQLKLEPRWLKKEKEGNQPTPVMLDKKQINEKAQKIIKIPLNYIEDFLTKQNFKDVGEASKIEKLFYDFFKYCDDKKEVQAKLKRMKDKLK